MRFEAIVRGPAKTLNRVRFRLQVATVYVTQSGDKTVFRASLPSGKAIEFTFDGRDFPKRLAAAFERSLVENIIDPSAQWVKS